MNVLDLFSGIGGFTLGLASAGFRTVAFCECEPFPRSVLAARWPGVPIYPDVRTLTAAQLAADGVVRPDVVCGGFPCQDISSAGRGAGIDGLRSGLWREMARIIGEVRPRWAIIENSPALRSRGADRVLGDLEALGYAAWPSVVGAVHAGAWHRRQRVWIVAYADGVREHEPTGGGHDQQLWAADLGQPHPNSEGHGWGAGRPGRSAASGSWKREPEWAFQGNAAADATGGGWQQGWNAIRPGQPDTSRGGAVRTASDAHGQPGREQQRFGSSSRERAWDKPSRCCPNAPDTDGPELRNAEQRQPRRLSDGVCDEGIAVARDHGAERHDGDVAGITLQDGDAGSLRAWSTPEQSERRGGLSRERGWSAQSDLVRVVYGLPDRLDRSAGLEAAEGLDWHPLSQEPDIPRTARGVSNRTERIAGLGNAVVPDVVAMIGRSILAVEAQI